MNITNCIVVLLATGLAIDKAEGQVTLGASCTGISRGYYRYGNDTSNSSKATVGTPQLISSHQSCPQDTGAGYGCNSCINPNTGKRNTLTIGETSTSREYSVAWTWGGELQAGWIAGPSFVVGGNGARTGTSTESETVVTPAVNLVCPERKQRVRKTERITTAWTQYLDEATCDWGGTRKYVRRYTGPMNPGAETGTQINDHEFVAVSTNLGCTGNPPAHH